MLAFQDGASYEWGRNIGMGVGVLLPATALIHALRRLSEPSNNRKCATALSLASGGWLLCSIAFLLTRLTDNTGCIMVVASLVGLAAMVTALVFAISGLSEGFSGSVSQGQGQAIGAIVIAAIFILATLFGFIRGWASDRIPKDWTVPQENPGKELSFGAKGFTFVVPDRDWVQVDPKKLNPMADLAFVQPKKKLFFILLAHPVAPGVVVTNERLAEVSRSELLQIDSAAQVSKAQAETAGLLLGYSFTGDARVASAPLTYRYWVHATRGHLYSLVAWGPRASRDQVVSEAARLCRNFAVTKP